MFSYLHFACVAGNNDFRTSIPIEIGLQRQHHSLRKFEALHDSHSSVQGTRCSLILPPDNS